MRTDVKKPPTEKKLSRLVTRLLEGGVVPFIGAGVSYDCVSKESGEQIARTGDMRCNVCKAISDDYRNHPHRCEDGCRNKEDSRCVNNRSLSEVCEEYVWRDGHSYEKLVMQVLRIGEFTKLKPTPAHRYLAFLAREGLVEEIITCNFDTCISQAFAQTFEDERVACESYAIVSNLEEYRKAGGRRSSAHGHPFLKIYHINGCAECLTGGGPANGCESILLTERQLQDWRDRHWGRELLKDRLRCRSVVFSGFGSPEPQVRHTVLQVVEEFQAHPEPSPERPTDEERNAESREVWECPNAPFLHSYERSLSFQQKQIPMGYTTANRMNCSVASFLKDGNVFSPEDKGLLCTEEATTRDKLKADHFWATVYQATFWELLRKAQEALDNDQNGTAEQCPRIEQVQPHEDHQGCRDVKPVTLLEKPPSLLGAQAPLEGIRKPIVRTRNKEQPARYPLLPLLMARTDVALLHVFGEPSPGLPEGGCAQSQEEADNEYHRF